MQPMTLKPLIVTLALSLATPAGAWWFSAATGNDTGGIIPWSEQLEPRFGDIAAAHCAIYDKIALITSVRRQYGDYVAFTCLFPPGYDPVKASANWWASWKR
jgi:hypothetical protein